MTTKLRLDLLSKPTIEQLASKLTEQKDYIKIAASQEDLYKSPTGYLPWNVHLRICFLSGTAETVILGYKNSDALCIKVGELSREAIIAGAPARYISRELCEAFMQTPIPVLPKEVIDIFPYVHIFLPRGVVFDHQGDEVISLIVRSGCLYPENMPDEALGRKIIEKFFPNEIFTPKELLGSYGFQVATITPHGSNFWQEFIDENAKSWQDEHIKQRENSGYGDGATEKVMRIAINCLLVHLYEPELITTDPIPKPSRGTGFSGGTGKSPLGPTWIGKGFRYQREKTNAPGGQERGSGNVRAHWRRGHWHTICHGKKRQERRVQWFKPVFVGSNAV